MESTPKVHEYSLSSCEGSLCHVNHFGDDSGPVGFCSHGDARAGVFTQSVVSALHATSSAPTCGVK